MTEEKQVSKPMQLWNQAVKAVKGDSTMQLVEDFTSEMTLVVEGLYEDQSRLRQALETLRNEQNQDEQSLRSEIEALENTLREHQRDTERRLTDISHRLDAIDSRKRKHEGSISAGMNKLIVLAGLICGSWIIETLLQLLK